MMLEFKLIEQKELEGYDLFINNYEVENLSELNEKLVEFGIYAFGKEKGWYFICLNHFDELLDETLTSGVIADKIISLFKDLELELVYNPLLELKQIKMKAHYLINDFGFEYHDFETREGEGDLLVVVCTEYDLENDKYTEFTHPRLDAFMNNCLNMFQEFEANYETEEGSTIKGLEETMEFENDYFVFVKDEDLL